MPVSDETLGAYLDCELDRADAHAVEAAIAADPALAARMAALRNLRERLRGHFDAVLDEQVPAQLLRTAREGAAGAANVTQLPRWREPAAPARAWSAWSKVTALAASAVLGALASGLWFQVRQAAPLGLNGGSLLAQGSLRAALDRQLAQAQAGRESVQIGISFRDHDGHYCRSFVLRDRRALAGLACRTPDGWSIDATAPLTDVPAEGGLRMAASAMPPAILATVQSRIAGDALDAEAERRAAAAHWR